MTMAGPTFGTACRACGGRAGNTVLDLGDQPACDHFPPEEDPGPDATYPLQMWQCTACGLAQLVADRTVPEEPRGIEPTALVRQSVDAVDRLAAAGWLPAEATVAEYGSPHGGSWLGLLAERGLVVVDDHDAADVVLDCFGLMHWPDQAAAMSDRAGRVAEGGVLLVQYHALAAIVRQGQWNMLRAGHYAYYSTHALVHMLSAVGFRPRTALRFDLYGGTVLLAATRGSESRDGPDDSVTELLNEENMLSIEDPKVVGRLQDAATSSSARLHSWLTDERAAGRTVLGYGAASRAVAQLCHAGVDSSLLAAVGDASPAKWGRRMPGTDIPVVEPEKIVSAAPDAVLLLLPDLMDEVRERLPGVEASDGRWVNIEDLCGQA